MVTTERPRTSRVPRVLLVIALVLGVLLVVAAFTVPMYAGSSTETSADGATTTTGTSATIAQMNGAWGVTVMSLPLAVTLLVLLVRRVLPPAPGTVVSWVLVVLLVVFCALGMASVGMYLFPVAVLLAAYLATSRTGSAGPA